MLETALQDSPLLEFVYQQAIDGDDGDDNGDDQDGEEEDEDGEPGVDSANIVNTSSGLVGKEAG